MKFLQFYKNSEPALGLVTEGGVIDVGANEGCPKTMLELCRHLSEQAPILPVCFKSVSMLLPSGAVENAIPTAANPFYNLAQWKIDIAE